MKMHRRTTKRGKYSNWNSEEGKAKIKQSVQKWFAEFNGTMSLIDYAKKEGIPVTTLRQIAITMLQNGSQLMILRRGN